MSINRSQRGYSNRPLRFPSLVLTKERREGENAPLASSSLYSSRGRRGKFTVRRRVSLLPQFSKGRGQQKEPLPGQFKEEEREREEEEWNPNRNVDYREIEEATALPLFRRIGLRPEGRDHGADGGGGGGALRRPSTQPEKGKRANRGSRPGLGKGNRDVPAAAAVKKVEPPVKIPPSFTGPRVPFNFPTVSFK
jgi:hypothetical protein